MYTIKQIATKAGVTTRTLRHYDRIGLLHASERSSSNYRLYSDHDLLLLQQILLYKEMDFELKEIQQILQSSSFNVIQSLKQHRTRVLSKQERLNQLLQTIDATIQAIKGGYTMKEDILFKGLKEQVIKDNDATYGKELREIYSNDVIEQSNQTIRRMSKWQWERAEKLGKDILEQLPEAMKQGVGSKEATSLCAMHQEWIQLYWVNYSKAAHLNLCKMYTEDERFQAYYDKAKPGGATFLYKAMKDFLSNN